MLVAILEMTVLIGLNSFLSELSADGCKELLSEVTESQTFRGFAKGEKKEKLEFFSLITKITVIHRIIWNSWSSVQKTISHHHIKSMWAKIPELPILACINSQLDQIIEIIDYLLRTGHSLSLSFGVFYSWKFSQLLTSKTEKSFEDFLCDNSHFCNCEKTTGNFSQFL